jgi:hypothetical protein
MRIRLGYLLEMVVALAVGLALARWSSESVMGAGKWTANMLLTRLRYAVEPALSGVALVGFAGVAVEVFRKRTPKVWGVGRWIWSLSGLLILIDLGLQLSFETVLIWRSKGRLPSSDQIQRVMRGLLSSHFFSQGAWFLLGVCVTAWAAGQLRDPDPDAREWTGRVFLAILVAWAVACRTLIVMAMR